MTSLLDLDELPVVNNWDEINNGLVEYQAKENVRAVKWSLSLDLFKVFGDIANNVHVGCNYCIFIFNRSALELDYETQELYVRTLKGIERVNVNDYLLVDRMNSLSHKPMNVFEATHEVVNIDVST